MNRIRQINGLVIYWDDSIGVYKVKIYKDKRILEEFSTLNKAIRFCEDTKDFLNKG